jgi:competence protein ComEA
VDPTTPPWRVFDAPSTEPDGQRATTPGGGPSAAATTRLRLQPLTVASLLGAAVLAVAAIAVALGGLGGMAVDAAGSSSSSGSGQPAASDLGPRGAIVVDVAGAVARPGVYHLAAGSRVGDAIAAAGGYGPRVAADRVGAELNLAALVRDGDRILVPSRDGMAPGASRPPGGPAASGTPGAALIDLNHATAEALDSLPGIGPVTADKIIASRAEKPFTSIDELRGRGLVGQKTFDKLKPLITVG